MNGTNKAAILTLTLVALTSVSSIATIKPAQAQNSVTLKLISATISACKKKPVVCAGEVLAIYKVLNGYYQVYVDCNKGRVKGANNLSADQQSSLATAACRKVGVR